MTPHPLSQLTSNLSSMVFLEDYRTLYARAYVSVVKHQMTSVCRCYKHVSMSCMCQFRLLWQVRLEHPAPYLPWLGDSSGRQVVFYIGPAVSYGLNNQVFNLV